MVLGVVYLVIRAVAADLSRRPRVPPAQLGAGDDLSRLALQMARLLDRQLGDDMIRCTFPPEMLEEARRLTDEFFTGRPGLPPARRPKRRTP